MYLFGFSLDNLSLMALTIATGFVVDDAIVVLENIARHVEDGVPRVEAALLGAREVGFTVLSITVSLIAVFLPILLMGGIVGRLFREFALTLSIAVTISLFISLTATPMLCSLFLRSPRNVAHGRWFHASERVFDSVQDFYRRTLVVALRHSFMVFLVLVGTVGLNVYLFAHAKYGLFPNQDNGQIIGNIQADQSISFQLMKQKLSQLQEIVQSDPAVANVVGFTGGRQTNSGFVFISLKPAQVRQVSADDVVARLRGKLAQVAGARLFLQTAADLRAGGRQSPAAYQFSLQGDDTQTLYQFTPKMTAAMMKLDEIADVNSDQQQKGLETDLFIDRPTAARLGLSLNAIDNTLYDAFGQRQVSVIYNPLNQYHVVMEVAPRYWEDPQTLKDIWVSTSGANPSGSQSTNASAGSFIAAQTPSAGTAVATTSTGSSTASTIAADSARNLAINSIAASGHSSASSGASVSTSKETVVPLAAFTSFRPGLTPLSVNHQGPFVAATISFNLAAGYSLGEAQAAIFKTMSDLSPPLGVHGGFAGTAATFQQSQSNVPLLIIAALATIYIVLGVLYESYIHPITILSTLPSAGVGALLGLMAFGLEFTIIAMIGVILLIGIVKKNAIMMVDFALQAERSGMSQEDAILQACLLRFRPIMMTTFAAMLGALPLAFGTGEGAELRHPLGISIVGGLIVSQALTLYTTPVIYLYLGRFGRWLGRLRGGARARPRIAGAGVQ
jgi:multidrug efflux pump